MHTIHGSLEEITGQAPPAGSRLWVSAPTGRPGNGGLLIFPGETPVPVTGAAGAFSFEAYPGPLRVRFDLPGVTWREGPTFTVTVPDNDGTSALSLLWGASADHTPPIVSQVADLVQQALDAAAAIDESLADPMTQAEATAGTSATSRFINAAVLKGAVQRWVTGNYSTAVTAIGRSLASASNAAAARTAIEAVATTDPRLSDPRTPTAHGHTTDEIEHVIEGDGTPLNVLFGAVISAVETIQTTIQEIQDEAYDSGEWVRTVSIAGSGSVEFAIRRVGGQVTLTVTGTELSASTPAVASVNLVQGLRPTPGEFAFPVSGVDGETGDTILFPGLVSDSSTAMVMVNGEVSHLGGSLTFSTTGPLPDPAHLGAEGFTLRT